MKEKKAEKTIEISSPMMSDVIGSIFSMFLRCRTNIGFFRQAVVLLCIVTLNKAEEITTIKEHAQKQLKPSRRRA